jgi:hypothetical protein
VWGGGESWSGGYDDLVRSICSSPLRKGGDKRLIVPQSVICLSPLAAQKRSFWKKTSSWLFHPSEELLKEGADTQLLDVLTLRECKHAFHSSCLISWFLIKRYDCPVCRRAYCHHGEV